MIDGRLLAELVEAYVTDARLRVAARTAGTYDYHLALLLEWWATAGPALGMRLDKRAWSLFEGWLSRRLSSQSGEPLTLLTRRSCLSRCKQMLRWAYRLGYLDRDFSDQVAQAKGSPVLRDALYDIYPLDANQHALIERYSTKLELLLLLMLSIQLSKQQRI